MRTADFDFELPPELIAQKPAPQRDESRLLILHRTDARIEHRQFTDLPDYLGAGDVLVLNNSRVIPARLHGVNAQSGGQFELLLLEENGVNDWWVMLRPGKRARPGTQIALGDLQGERTSVHALVLDKNAEGHRRVRFIGTPNIFSELTRIGTVPLPPYIDRKKEVSQAADRERYQTIFAGPAGSVAAPTAGLHFTERLLGRIRARGTRVCFVTLHVGLGTFAPVKVETLAAHTMHEEQYELPGETAQAIGEARQKGGRIVAVGTTTLRVLESVARTIKSIEPQAAASSCAKFLPPASAKTRLFIYPPTEFKIVDALLTNFHLPRSTLLMLVSAFAAPGRTSGRDLIMAAYNEAIRQRYRFFSYGDAMLIL